MKTVAGAIIGILLLFAFGELFGFLVVGFLDVYRFMVSFVMAFVMAFIAISVPFAVGAWIVSRAGVGWDRIELFFKRAAPFMYSIAFFLGIVFMIIGQ